MTLGDLVECSGLNLLVCKVEIIVVFISQGCCDTSLHLIYMLNIAIIINRYITVIRWGVVFKEKAYLYKCYLEYKSIIEPITSFEWSLHVKYDRYLF